MKRIWAFVLAVAFSLALALPALADSIVEPPGNDFYRSHRRELKVENRFYFLNGAEGYVTLFEAPEGRAVENLPNGERLQVYAIWEGSWGIISYAVSAGRESSAWVRLEDMAEQYDRVCFTRDHAHELRTLSEPRLLDFTQAGGAALWEFPGAEEPAALLEIGAFDSYDWDAADGRATFHRLYTDPLGREWGEVEDSKLYSGRWVCLEDPASEAPAYVDEAAAARRRGEGLIPAAETVPVITPPGSGFPWPALGLAAGAVLLSALLLALFRKKKHGGTT